jgi:NDP-mannose synthase
MKAIILAGGKGTRLKPYTTSLPKPLMPIGDKPVLEHVLMQLKKFGFRDITLAVNHLAELIQAFFGNGEKWGLNLSYSIEDRPLNTVGPLKIMDGLPENFLVLNGDVLTDLDLGVFWKNHIDNESLVSVATTSREVKADFGVIEFDDNLKMTGFFEKPTHIYHVSMGLYVMNRSVLKYIPESQPFGFDNLMTTLLEKSLSVNIFPYNGFWLDIGRPEDYDRANTDLLDSIHEICS